MARPGKTAKTGGKDSVSFEVVVKPTERGLSVFDDSAFPAVENLDLFRTPREKSIETARKLERNGISVKHIGEFSISAECSPTRFEKFFSTQLKTIKPPAAAKLAKNYVMRAPDRHSPWELPRADGLDNLIDRAYIIHSGRVLTEGRPNDIVENADVRRVYLGDQFRL